jgi:hypothetical protein
MGQRGKGIKDAQSSANWRLIMMIHKSELYDSFEIANNRDVDQKHVLALMRSIVASDHTASHPISVKYVDGKMWIFDGQHRFMACRRLCLPIYYIIDNNAHEDALLNIQTSKKWTGWDTLCHLSKKVENAKDLKMMVEHLCRFGKVNVMVAGILLDGKANGGRSAAAPTKLTAEKLNTQKMKEAKMRFGWIDRVQSECTQMAGERLITTVRGMESIVVLIEMGADLNRLIFRINDAGKSVQFVADKALLLEFLIDLYNYRLQHGRIEKPVRS